jgi:hypothetical protein
MLNPASFGFYCFGQFMPSPAGPADPLLVPMAQIIT